jgi:hypothetical protein
MLRSGNAGSNTAADHITVLDQALAQLPEHARSGRILVRTDGAGYAHAFVEYLTSQGLVYSLGYAVTEVVREAISLLPEWAWTIADNHDGQRGEGAQVADLTLVVAEATRLRRARQARERAAAGKPVSKPAPASWPEGMREIVRRECPHPGAQLDAFEERDGWRYQTFATNTKAGQIAFLEVRHRAHARVEDRIRQSQNAGLHRLPSQIFTINEAW